MRFPVSGVDAPLWLPPLMAFVISFFTSMGGMSGAFLLLPFQMSYLGFTSPAVSPTNLVYNIVSIPSGMIRYFREGRMIWPLALIVMAGTLPGVIAGGFIRLIYLPQPGAFKVFVACVLLYIGARMILDFVKTSRRAGTGAARPENSNGPEEWRVRILEFNRRRLAFCFGGNEYRPSLWGTFILAVAVGVVGGVYGIGGGVIMTPFFVAVLGLPIHAVAGASLMGAFLTSVIGVCFYQATAPFFSRPGLTVAPDWLLGTLFGIGGLAGMYLGARTQRYVQERWLKLMLGCLVLIVAICYLQESI